MAPGGRQPYCMEIIKTQKPASQKKSPKLQPQCVSNSAAASASSPGRTTDAVTSLPGTPYSVRLQPRRRMQGWVLRAGGPPPALSGVFLPRFFLRYRRKNRPPGGRWPYRLVDIKT